MRLNVIGNKKKRLRQKCSNAMQCNKDKTCIVRTNRKVKHDNSNLNVHCVASPTATLDTDRQRSMSQCVIMSNAPDRVVQTGTSIARHRQTGPISMAHGERVK